MKYKDEFGLFLHEKDKGKKPEKEVPVIDVTNMHPVSVVDNSPVKSVIIVPEE